MERYSNKRLRLRGAGGRFRQPSMERDFGLRVAVCDHCGGFNSYSRADYKTPSGMIDPHKFNTWVRPETCGQCGAILPEED